MDGVAIKVSEWQCPEPRPDESVGIVLLKLEGTFPLQPRVLAVPTPGGVLEVRIQQA